MGSSFDYEKAKQEAERMLEVIEREGCGKRTHIFSTISHSRKILNCGEYTSKKGRTILCKKCGGRGAYMI